MEHQEHQTLLPDEAAQLLFAKLKARFETNMHRHQGLNWQDIATKLANQPLKLLSLYQMEDSDGEPDVVGYDEQTAEYIFFDCSTETPKFRRSICYDRQALESRKENKPWNSAIDLAAEMGIELLTQEQYFQLQQLGNFDTKTSSWLVTPAKIRKLGGAIFGDNRYSATFIYHNGADAYFAARGFRGCLKV